jgi:hypothetical protein
MSTCVRPHCAIRSHHHEHEEQPPEVQQTPYFHYEVSNMTLQAPELPANPCTFAELLQYSQHFCDIAKSSYFDDKSLIKDYMVLFNDGGCNIKYYLCTKIIKDLLVHADDQIIENDRKLGILYIYSMLRTPIAQFVLKNYEKFNKAVEKKYNQFLIESIDDLHFVNQMMAI